MWNLIIQLNVLLCDLTSHSQRLHSQWPLSMVCKNMIRQQINVLFIGGLFNHCLITTDRIYVVELNERLPQSRHEFSTFEDTSWAVFSVRPIHVIEHRLYRLTSGKICVTVASVRKSNRRYGNVHEGKTPDMFQILCPLT